jgi:uncharacterized protein
MAVLTKEEALQILEKNDCPTNVIAHCVAVSNKACEIGGKVLENGVTVDLDFIETASLLHDVGRCVSHGIDHGVHGAKIMGDYPEYARVCECHLGGGIEKSEAVELDLPEKDFIPETLEEKIICIADKLTEDTKYITIDEAVERFRKRLGCDHPTIDRMKKIYEEITNIIGDNIEL